VHELSIIVPCRDDAALLPGTLEVLHRVVTHHSLSVETLIVDDNSKDATLEVGKKAALRFPALHIRLLARKRLQPGLGGMLRYGLAFAQGRFAVLVSSDGQDPVELLPIFLQHLRSGKHLVQCSRYLRAEDAAAVPAEYRLYQMIYRSASQLLLGNAPPDTTYGFRAFDRIFIQALGLSAKRFNVCPEMTYKVMLCGGSIEYVPGKHGLKEGGQSKFQLPSEIWGYAYVLFRAALHRASILRWF
jgi:glycosyltransferase involved in cell wall biosynthesis